MSASVISRVGPRNPILLLGVGGILYRAWAALLDDLGVSHIDLSYLELDLTQPETIRRHVEHGYPLVINCAAYTDVDGAESNPQPAMQINGHGVGALARECQAAGSMLVHYSTDYVFSGQQPRPWHVDDACDPVNLYGQSKLLGEQLIRDSGAAHLIVRTSWLYAPWGKNFVRTIAKLASERPSLRVVADQFGRPTSAEHLAKGSFGLLERDAQGTLHLCDGGQCSWFDFAAEIVRISGHACRVEPCSSSEFPRPARRPMNSVLDLSDTEALIGPRPAWQDCLADVMARLEPGDTPVVVPRPSASEPAPAAEPVALGRVAPPA